MAEVLAGARHWLPWEREAPVRHHIRVLLILQLLGCGVDAMIESPLSDEGSRLMFDETYLKRLKAVRWRDVQLPQTTPEDDDDCARAEVVRRAALERLVRTQTLIAAIEAARERPPAEDLEGLGIDGYPLDPESPWFRREERRGG